MAILMSEPARAMNLREPGGDGWPVAAVPIACLFILSQLAACGEEAAEPASSMAIAPTVDELTWATAPAESVAAGQSESTDSTSEVLPPRLGRRQQGSDWPTFLGIGSNGKSDERGLPDAWPPGGPPVVWHAALGTSYGSPAISRGRLYHFDRHGGAARLTCRESETGKELWKYEHETAYRDMLGYNNGPRCSPIVDGNRVYTFSAEGILTCLNATDGRLRWQLDVNDQFNVVQNFFGVGSTPLVVGDLLIVNVGGSPPNSPEIYSGRVRGRDSGVVAFDKWSGQVRYQVTDELASYASPVFARIGGREWCFVFARGGLIGMKPSSGSVDFHFPWRSPKLESANASNPVVVGDEVFVSETYGPGSALLRVMEGGYEIIWRDRSDGRSRAMQTHWNTPIYVDGYLYGSSGRHTSNAELRCIEWSTGEVKWSEPGLTRCSLLYVDDYFVVVGEGGTVHIVRANPERFERVLEFSPRNENGQSLLPYPAWAAPVLAHGLLYARGKDRLVCLDLIPEPVVQRSEK